MIVEAKSRASRLHQPISNIVPGVFGPDSCASSFRVEIVRRQAMKRSMTCLKLRRRPPFGERVVNQA
jgi:hypothetical protein